MRTRAWVAIGVVTILCLGWIGVVVCFAIRKDSAVLGPVGDSLAPVASLLTVLALFLAFEQRHEDSDRAHHDQLGHAYATWFDKAWMALGAVHNTLSAQIALNDLRLIFNALNEASSAMHNLRRAVAPLLMIEREEAMVTRLELTYRSLPTFDKIAKDNADEFRSHANRVLVLLSERRDDVDALLKDALIRHRGVVGDAPTA